MRNPEQQDTEPLSAVESPHTSLRQRVAGSLQHLFTGKPKKRRQRTLGSGMEKLEKRELLAADAVEFFPEIESFDGNVALINLDATADTTSFKQPWPSYSASVSHEGGVDDKKVTFPVQDGNSDRFAIIVESGGKKQVLYVNKFDGKFMDEQESWLLQKEKGEKAWGNIEHINGATVGTLLKEGQKQPEPAMHVAVGEDGKTLEIDFHSPYDSTYFELDTHPLPRWHKTIDKIYIAHKGGIVNGHITLQSSGNESDSGGRPVRMINAEGEGDPLDLVYANWDNGPKKFQKVSYQKTWQKYVAQEGEEKKKEEKKEESNSQESLALTPENWKTTEGSPLYNDDGVILPSATTIEAISTFDLTKEESQRVEFDFVLTPGNTQFMAYIKNTNIDQKIRVFLKAGYTEATLYVGNNRTFHTGSNPIKANVPATLVMEQSTNGLHIEIISSDNPTNPYIADHGNFPSPEGTYRTAIRAADEDVHVSRAKNGNEEGDENMSNLIQQLAEHVPAVVGRTEEQVQVSYTEKVDEVHSRLTTLDTYRNNASADDQELVNNVSALLQREKISHSRMYVEVGNITNEYVEMTVRVESPLPSVRVELTGESVVLLENEAGIQDQTITIRRHRDANYGNKAPLQISLLNGADESELLDVVYVSYNQDARLANIMTDQKEWEDSETGLMKENPIQPELGVMDIQGNNVLVYFATPHDQSVVSFSSGGMLASVRSEHDSGTMSGYAYLSFDTGKGTGCYSIDLYSTTHGAKLDSIGINWNKETQELSLDAGQKLWTADDIVSGDRIANAVGEVGDYADVSSFVSASLITEAEMVLDTEEMSILAEKFNGLKSTFTTDRALAHIQASNLYYKSSFYVPPNDFEPMVDAYIQKFIPDRVGDRGMRSDLVGEFYKLMGSYENTVGRLLVSAIDVYVRMRSGTPESEMREQFSNEWNINAHTRYMNELVAFGVQVPSEGDFLKEAWTLYNEEIDYLLHVKSEDTRLQAKADRLGADRGYQIAHGVPDLAVIDRVLATAEDGYSTGYLSEDQNRRLGRAQRLAQGAASQLTDSRVVMRFDSAADPNVARANHLQNGSIEIVMHPTRIQENAFIADTVAVKENNKDPEGAANEIEKEYDEASRNILNDLIVGGLRIDGIDIETNPLAKGNGIRTVDMAESGTTQVPITITEDTMFNVWVNGRAMRNVTLTITGGDIPTNGYSSDHAGVSGDSISLRLPPGTYSIEIQDMTNYNGGTTESGDFAVPLNYNIQEFNSAEIEGRMSIEGRAQALPVSMRVAEFDGDDRIITYDEFNEDTGKYTVERLDPSKPIMVIFHGRSDSELGSNVNDLTSALYEYSQANSDDYQIVTINWEDAAEDTGIVSQLRDAAWTPEVGKWVASQLMSLGFDPDKIDFLGHSHGTFGSYFAAKELRDSGYGIPHGIIALDPANNHEILNGGYDVGADQIAFSEVAQNSLAIQATVDGNESITKDALNFIQSAVRKDIPGLLDSWNNIEYGSKKLANTAHQSFALVEHNEIMNHADAHGYPVTLFANLIRSSIGSSEALGNSPLGLEAFLGNKPGAFSIDPDRDFNGVIMVDSYPDEIDSSWRKARPLFLDFEDYEDISFL